MTFVKFIYIKQQNHLKMGKKREYVADDTPNSSKYNKKCVLKYDHFN